MSPIAASATTLTDGSFSSVTATSFAAGGATVTSQAPCASCGNPEAGLQANFSVGTSPGISDVGFVDTGLSYNPGTSGAIASISGSYDRFLALTGLGAQPNFFRLVIEQGGIDYGTAVSIGGTDSGGAWHTLSASALTASSFTAFNFATGVSGSTHPDFSSSGALMTFGVFVLADLTASGQAVTADFDNLSVTITQTPLPAALPLFATGLAGLGLLGWHRKKKAAPLNA